MFFLLLLLLLLRLFVLLLVIVIIINSHLKWVPRSFFGLFCNCNYVWMLCMVCMYIYLRYIISPDGLVYI